MKKTRDLFKKIIHSKGTFHENMGTIKDRNFMNLTEAEDTKHSFANMCDECNFSSLNILWHCLSLGLE